MPALYRRETMWVASLMTLLLSLADNPSPSIPPACPDPDDVATQLSRLGVNQGTQPEIAITDNRMRVILRGKDGAILGSREVEASTSCHERANVAAVLVATWMGVWPEARVQAPVPRAPREAPVPHAPPPRAAFGLSLLSTLDRNGVAWGAGAETMFHLHGPVHAVLAVSATTERAQPIGPAQVGYRRPAVTVGPALALGRGRVRWQMGATGQAGVLLMRGKGLATVHRTTSAEFGAGAFLRVLLAGKRFTPFVNLGAGTWFGHQRATLDDAPDSTLLPRWDAQLALGVCFIP
jgi:hypothetical protein